MAERPSPYSISICTLIALLSDPTSPLRQELDLSDEIELNVSAFLQECVLLNTTYADAGSISEPMTLSWSSAQASSLTWFLSRLRSIAGAQLSQLLADYVNLAASSVDSLIDLMESLKQAVSLEGIVDSTSSHGIFLRKVCLGFDMLSFETTSILWSDLQSEIKDAMEWLQQQHQQQFTSTAAMIQNNEEEMRWPLSAAQMEQALQRQCFRLYEISSEGEVTFEEMEFRLQRVLEHNPELSQAHFLRFLNCVKHGERVGALDALHQYFDYAIIQSNKNKSQDILQFAAILLASLHHSFGDNALARMATDEAVRVAQQSMDAACVAFALGWIFSNEEGGDSPLDMSLDAGDLLNRCASRAMEGHLRSLSAGASLSLARHQLSVGYGIANSPSQGIAESAWNSITDSSSDRLSGGGADGAVDRPTIMTDIVDSRDIMDTLARQKLVAAGIWDYFGQTYLSGVSSFVALYCHADQMLSHDIASAIQNLARVSLYGSSSTLLSREFDGSVLQKQLVDGDKLERVETNDCVYANSLSKLTSLWKLFGLPMDAVFLQSATTILHEWAIRRGEIHQATAFGIALESYLHPRLPNYWEVMIDVYAQKSLLLSRQGLWHQAKALLQDTIKIANENKLKTQHASLLLQLSLIHLDSNPHQFAAALPPLLECLTLTENSQMDGIHATALSVLAQIHLRMRNPNRAIALLQAALPSLLQGEHVWYQGEAMLTMAKSRLQLTRPVVESEEVKKTRSTTAKKTALMRLAVKDLKQSLSSFLRCQDCVKLREVYYLLARVFDAIPGEQTVRDQASQAFLDISNHLKCADQPQPGLNGATDCLSSIDALETMINRHIPAM